MYKKEQEIEIKNLSLLPKNIFHLVPEELFNKFINKNGDYDCRYKKVWGNNSPFIHTTPTKKQLKKRVADVNWSKYPIKKNFLLLKIDTRKINSKVTYSIFENNIYHHIWGKLLKESFQIIDVVRDKNGKFLFL
ncbi:MAG: hypothetical protein UR25_C0005G0060 [Candidatus Nomurabacteria bacterium GW2011_GWE1_32_28]|uniref:Uncharacterized protein n=1 Tax=Candidatus Nomurabacteria bacterium GW2011_GWF1_31_48 TaxID=1618767 RepID=A0A0F9YEN7_9BACT|nr:MAG: hypothetical protein UR10_C0006G0031 [Candidatus Nomurabacteria bacterium GW2011_GWF2_30_133]KKP28238.1 MAG: hypothetical protein UR18_C0007G0006 [Candidatus Nomurabacteria bacterium GW2011_GWE2_31_40]KKP29833.1 MAG: hypothetical protein UR19_C0007G0007 [Candidatus Nomurabacteria bacterium GW2011_GWF1_31_48]KKP34574.1 MAG: hypothetical protein UR25_C0005G0060 [Candidatus Nomurabacteria bacterium GW2011_GWE1_32_28]HAS80442.1 hypothetical protein [Candidatus Nomurabacteria bacterium]